MIRRLFTTVAVTGAVTVATAGAALAVGPAEATVAATPAFACSPDAPAPPHHCMNVRSQGKVGLLLVVEPDPRGPAEGITFDPAFDDRPCPHDPDSSDGTWWQPIDPVTGETLPFYVCHHRPGRDG